MSGSDMWADVGNLFGGGAAQILSNISAALGGIASEQGEEAFPCATSCGLCHS